MTTKIPVELSSTPGIVDGSNATAITIDSSEQVGIGETSPAAPLHVEHSSGTAYNGAAEITESLIVSNKAGTDNSGVNNVASIGLHVADGATSQAFLNYVRTGNNTGDFTITQRTGSSTYVEALRIDNAGHVTKPKQTAVLVSKSNSQLNIAVDAGVTHVFDNEQFDVNGDFASNTFTAPVTGKYLVCLQVRWQNIPTNINYIQTWLATSNGTRYMGLFGSGTDLFNNDCDYYRDSQSIIIDMDANDTFTVTSQQSSGTQATDIGQESYLSVALLS